MVYDSEILFNKNSSYTLETNGVTTDYLYKYNGKHTKIGNTTLYCFKSKNYDIEKGGIVAITGKDIELYSVDFDNIGLIKCIFN